MERARPHCGGCSSPRTSPIVASRLYFAQLLRRKRSRETSLLSSLAEEPSLILSNTTPTFLKIPVSRHYLIESEVYMRAFFVCQMHASLTIECLSSPLPRHSSTIDDHYQAIIYTAHGPNSCTRTFVHRSVLLHRPSYPLYYDLCGCYTRASATEGSLRYSRPKRP
jgi:hypothetical protein